jgi:hypothetical protein
LIKESRGKICGEKVEINEGVRGRGEEKGNPVL